MSDFWVPTNNSEPTGSEYYSSNSHSSDSSEDDSTDSSHESTSGGIKVKGSPSEPYSTSKVYYGNAVKTQMGNTVAVYVGGYMANYTPYTLSTTVGLNTTIITGYKTDVIVIDYVNLIKGYNYKEVANYTIFTNSWLHYCFEHTETNHSSTQFIVDVESFCASRIRSQKNHASTIARKEAVIMEQLNTAMEKQESIGISNRTSGENLQESKYHKMTALCNETIAQLMIMSS
jgi:hypothetical protein